MPKLPKMIQSRSLLPVKGNLRVRESYITSISRIENHIRRETHTTYKRPNDRSLYQMGRARLVNHFQSRRIPGQTFFFLCFLLKKIIVGPIFAKPLQEQGTDFNTELVEFPSAIELIRFQV